MTYAPIPPQFMSQERTVYQSCAAIRIMRVSKLLYENLVDNCEATAGVEPQCYVPLERGTGVDNLERATRFVRMAEEWVKSALKGDKLVMPQFGEEFEFSPDRTFLNVRGQGFDKSLCIETGNIVDTIRGHVPPFSFRLRITARFGDNFLRHMIALSEGFLELETLGARPTPGEVDWLLWYLWKVRLKLAFAAGLPKLYVARADRLPIVRGNFDLNTWLHMPVDLGRYPCRFREHSYDNPVTRLVNATFHYLSECYDRTAGLLSDMQSIRSAFREACGDQRRRVERTEVGGIRNPYFVAYDEVARLSQFILADQGATIGTGDDEFAAMLFDVSLLFEHYIRRLLRNGRLALQPKNPSNPVRYPIGKDRHMKMLPDIVLHGRTRTLMFLHNNRDKVILDVKYKRWERWSTSRERQRADLFQVMSYAAAYRGRSCDPARAFSYGLVFPTFETNQQTIKAPFCELGIPITEPTSRCPVMRG
jgi:5-methylcytosine-specific restriction enzyme subunit McrC